MAINFSNLAGIQQGNTASRPQSPVVGLLYYNTELNYFESYSSNGWFPIAAPPTPPTSIVATNSGSGRAYDNGSASVAFTAATTGGSPTSFIVRPTPSTSPATFTGSSSPIIATNLLSNTGYTYTVVSSSPYGNSSDSAASSSVVATTKPQAPTIGAVTGGDALATVAYTAGATGGSAITTFTATSSPGGFIGTGSSPITVSGLTNNTAYTFTVTATNSNGTSVASAASGSVTPGVSGAWESIATLTGGAPNISFTSIPSTYKHLQIRYTCQSNRPDPSGFGSLIFNSDSSASYSGHTMAWDNETAGSVPYASGGSSTGTGFSTWYMGSQSSSSPATMIWDILDYTNTNKYKVIRSKHSMSNGQSGASRRSDIALMGGYWRNTSAINTITFTGGYQVSNLTGTFALYGIKG